MYSKYRGSVEEPRPWRDTVESYTPSIEALLEPRPWRDTVESNYSKYRGSIEEPRPWRNTVELIYSKYRGSRKALSLERCSGVGQSLWSVSQVKSVWFVYM